MKRAALLAAAIVLLGAGEPPTPPEQETEHVVQAGETLTGIALRAKVPRVLIAEANGLAEPYALRAGQKLKIPRTRRHTVKRGDSGFSIAYAYGVPWEDIAVANSLAPDAPLKTGSVLLIPTLIAVPKPTAQAPATSAAPAPGAAPAAPVRFAWPLSGPVRRGFGGSDSHDGIDITAREGSAVRASAAGKVRFVGSEPRRLGNFVVIDHGDGWATAYAFLKSATVAEDEEVRAGERIGFVGTTGLAKGAELHFELRRNNRPLDPEARLAAINPAPRTPRPSPGKPIASKPDRPAAPRTPAPSRPKPARPRG